MFNHKHDKRCVYKIEFEDVTKISEKVTDFRYNE